LADDFVRLREIVEQACGLPARERADWLAEACAGDGALLERARGLLDDALEVDGFLEPLPPAAVAPAGLLPLGERVGSFRLTRVLGAGGMGTVYLAEQERPQRKVALKVVPAGPLATPSRQRFQAEIEALASLCHPGIAQVYESGVHVDRGQELPWFAMEFVEGARSILEHGRSLPLAGRVALLIDVCDAVHHGHQQGVIHRDLKPDNLLVGADGRPKVIDFGVARTTTRGATTLTHTGEILGTLFYMSPEQLLGDPGSVDVRSDVYSLGVVLYELLTGERPHDFGRADLVTVARTIRESPPRKPSRLVPRLKGDLETILLKCLEKDPEWRYESASALKRDLQCYLRHEPISARPPSALYHLAMLARRHKAASAALALALVALVGGLVVSLRFAFAADRERREAQFQAYLANIAAADAALTTHNVADAARRLDYAPAALRGWEWDHLHHRLDQSEATFAWPGQHALALAWGPRGRLLACSSTGRSGRSLVRVWEGGEQRLELDVGPVVALAFSRDGERLALGGMDGRVLVRSTDGAEVCALEGHERAVRTLAFLPDGRLLSGGRDGTVRTWDLADAAQIDVHRLPDAIVAANGTLAVAADGTVRTADGDTFRLGAAPTAAAVSADGRLLAFGAPDRTLRFRDLEAGRVRTIASGHTAIVQGVAFTTDGEHVVTGAHDGALRVWETATGRCVSVLHGHRSLVVVAVAVDPATGRVASASADGDVKFWDASPREPIPTLRGHRAVALGFDRAGERLATCAHDGTVTVWDVARRRPLQSLAAEGDALYAVAVEGERVVAAGENDVLHAWTDGRRRTRAAGQGGVHAIVFTPDGSALLTGGDDGSVRAWDARSLEPRATWRLHDARVRCLAVDAAGGRFASGGADRVAHVSDLATGGVLVSLRGHEAKIVSLAFTPDGAALATGAFDLTVRLWDLANGRELHSFHDTVVAGITPDARRLVSVGGTLLKLWDLESRQLVATLRGHRHIIVRALLSPDGATIASIGRNISTDDRELKLWLAPHRVR